MAQLPPKFTQSRRARLVAILSLGAQSMMAAVPR